MPAKSKSKPNIGDIDDFTDFIYNKWQKLARKTQLKDWSERRYEQFDNYIKKLINKMKKGEENCNRVMEKLNLGVEDEETEQFRRRREALGLDLGDLTAKVIEEASEKIKTDKNDNKQILVPLNFDIEGFRRSIMHEFHQKVSEAEAKRKKQGARSSMTHWMTHIMRKFKQIIEYHIMECTVDPINHENLSSRFTNLLARRSKLHEMGDEMIKKSKAYFERQAKKNDGATDS